jgi:hypothetical protein
VFISTQVVAWNLPCGYENNLILFVLKDCFLSLLLEASLLVSLFDPIIAVPW